MNTKKYFSDDMIKNELAHAFTNCKNLDDLIAAVNTLPSSLIFELKDVCLVELDDRRLKPINMRS